MMSDQDNLWDIYQTIQGFYRIIDHAQQELTRTGNQIHSTFIVYALDQIRLLETRKATLDLENLAKLIALCSEEDYPHSIRTWLEDEYKDLIG